MGGNGSVDVGVAAGRGVPVGVAVTADAGAEEVGMAVADGVVTGGAADGEEAVLDCWPQAVANKRIVASSSQEMASSGRMEDEVIGGKSVSEALDDYRNGGTGQNVSGCDSLIARG